MDSNYADRYGRFHDKPCKNGEPSSNNGWTYTPIAKYLGIELDTVNLKLCFEQCKRSTLPIVVDRHPNDMYPPMSHDELIGLIALGLVNPIHVVMSDYNFCNLPGYERKDLTVLVVYKALKAAWRIRPFLRFDGTKAHRNDLWTEPDLWCLGFRLNLKDQWYVRRKGGFETSYLHTAYFYAASYLTIIGKAKKPSDNSGKNLLFIVLSDLGMQKSWLYKKLDHKKSISHYFGPEHTFTKKLNEAI